MIRAATRLSLLVLVATAGGAQAAFPNFTNLLAAELVACVPAARSNVQCLKSSSVGVKRVQAVVLDVRNISGILQNLSTVATTTNDLASAITSVPIVGQVLTPFALVLRGLKTAVDAALRTVRTVDGVTWLLKPSLDGVLAVTNRAATLLNTTAAACDRGGALVNRTRIAVAALRSGPVRGNLASTMEKFSLVVRGPVNLGVRALSASGSACASIQQFASRTLPNITMIKEGLGSVTRFLTPIFQNLNNLWNKEYCLSLLRVAKYDSEISTILDLNAQQKIVLRSEDGAEFADIAKLKADTSALQKLNICVSLKNITSAISGIPDFVLNSFYSVLNATLSELQLSVAPGLPSFVPLQNLATSFSNQSLSFQFNFDLINKLASTKFDCPAAVLKACTSVPQYSAVAAACSNPIG